MLPSKRPKRSPSNDRQPKGGGGREAGERQRRRRCPPKVQKKALPAHGTDEVSIYSDKVHVTILDDQQVLVGLVEKGYGVTLYCKLLLSPQPEQAARVTGYIFQQED